MALAAPTRPELPHPAQEIPPLEHGDHLDRTTFHARCEAKPPGVRAELIDGRVFRPSPAADLHGDGTAVAIGWLFFYAAHTPGVLARNNLTVVLSETSESQPDACLMIDPALRGQTTVEHGWRHGAPELVVEVASTTAAYDLYEKMSVYESAFRLVDGRYVEQRPDDQGFFRSVAFPGLWLNAPAALASDSAAVLKSLEEGVATPEHAQFAARLQNSSK